jgi:hypothetical protein
MGVLQGTAVWVSVLVALLSLGGLPVAVLAQTAATASAYERLTSVQRRLVDDLRRGQGAGNAGREAYDHTDATFRTAFEAVTAALSAVSLSDSENGEILGTAIDLVDALPPDDAQHALVGTMPGYRLVVVLAPGAFDRLRRSAEFERIPAAEGRSAATVVYRRQGPPTVEIAGSPDGVRATITVD